MKSLFALIALLVWGVRAFAPPAVALGRQVTSTSSKQTTTDLAMIGGLLQGIFGQKDAEITETVYFDVSVDGQSAGRIEMGLYGSTVPKVGFLVGLNKLLHWRRTLELPLAPFQLFVNHSG